MDAKERPANPVIERRNLTVMECDLVGSTSLANHLDPEELRDLVLVYQDLVLSLIHEHEGYFAQFAGDAVWAYFGYPRAHEDDPVRAIRAGLAICRAIKTISLHNRSLDVRVGIATGLCVVGDLRQSADRQYEGPGEYISAIGDPPNLAARLQAIAGEGKVAVSDNTRAAAGQAIQFEDLGYHSVKGFDHKVRVWCAKSETRQSSRFQSRRSVVHGPLVGRSTELSTIIQLWKLSRSGSGQVIYVCGEPGIGKSRLLAEATENIIHPGSRCWWLHCNEHLQDSPFAPVIALLRNLLAARTKGQQVNSATAFDDLFSARDEDDRFLIAELLSLDNYSGLQQCSLSPARRQQRLNEILQEVVENECRQGPLTLLIEDHHWIDPSSESFLARLAAGIDTLPLLMMISSRLDVDARETYSGKARVHPLRLEQLLPEESVSLARALWQTDRPPDNTIRQIVERTDGVPLFIEDVVLSLQQNAAASGQARFEEALTLPSSLAAHLMSRIDKLGDNKHFTQVAAVVGRAFSKGIMLSLTGIDDTAFDNTVLALMDAGLLVRADDDDEESYQFRHALIQEAAYDSLLIARRRGLHSQIASWYVSNRPHMCQEQPEMIALHYEKAGDVDMALKYWRLSGERAKARSNYAESLIHLSRARRLIALSPAGERRDRQELDIVRTLAASFAGAEGISAEEAGQTYDDAIALCKRLDYPDDIFPILSGAGSFHFLRGNYEKVREISSECLHLGREKNSEIGDIIGNRILGASQFITGNFNDAIISLERAIDVYDNNPGQHGNASLAYAMDHKTSSLCYLALSQLMVGETELALDTAGRAVQHAGCVDLHSLNYALCYSAGLNYFRGDSAEVLLEAGARSLELALKEHYPSWIGMSRLLAGIARIRLGNVEEGLAEVKKGLEEHRQVMAQSFMPVAQGILAEAYIAVRDDQQGQRLLEQAEQLSRESGQFWYLPEVLRLRALHRAGKGDPDSARKLYQAAQESADEISAVYWQDRIIQSRAALGH